MAGEDGHADVADPLMSEKAAETHKSWHDDPYETQATSEYLDVRTTRLWIIGGVVLLALYLFLATLFYKLEEEWVWVDAMYFTVVTMTTVGYGQFVPSTDLTRAMTTLLIMIGVVLSPLVMATIQQSTMRTIAERTSLGQSRWGELVVPLFIHVLFIFSYTAIVHFYDEHPWVTSWYFVITSFSTVGYGDVLLKDQVSRLMGIPFLLIGCACWTYLLTSILTMLVTQFQLQHCQKFFKEKITRERLMKMDSNSTGDVSRAEFMEFMLLETRFVDPEVIIQINEAFDYLAAQSQSETKQLVQMAPRPVLNLRHIVTTNKPGVNLLKRAGDDFPDV